MHGRLPRVAVGTWITGEAARADVQTWRARSSAVLTGAGTVRVDDPRLDVRLAYGPWIRQPSRVVLDPDLTCPPSSKIFAGGPCAGFCGSRGGNRRGAGCGRCLRKRGRHRRVGGAGARIQFQVSRVPRTPRGLDLAAVIDRLAALEVNELLVECGPRLAGAFLEARLVDELILYVAPSFLGADAAPLAALSGLGASDALPRFEFREQRLIQNDLRLVLTPKRN